MIEDTTTHLIPNFDLCEEKTAKVMRWLIESEDASKSKFAVAGLFENGVLPENTKSFFGLLLEEKYPGKDRDIELSAQELHGFLSDAFIKAYRYLLTPQSLLLDLLSFDSEDIHINVKMLARLNALIDYPYFPELLEEWFAIVSKNNISGDRKSELQKFLSDVDRSIIKYSTPKEFIKYLLPLFDYLGSQIIHRENVRILLADKGLTLASDNSGEEFTAEELSILIKDAFQKAEDAVHPEELPPIPAYDSFLMELREIGVVLPPPHTLAEDKKNLPPLEMFITSKLRKKCLEKIFHHNENEYERTISMLNEIEDYSQAELNLHTLLQIHKVSSDTKVARRLTEALHHRFGITSITIDTE